jgi:hypothetical protein
MIQYFINRAGKGLSANRKRELEKAKAILQRKRTDAKKGGRAEGRRGRSWRSRRSSPRRKK